jgi:hypothetical protein
MANSEHLAKLEEGVDAWNDWRKANPGIVPDLNGADLSGASIGYTTFGNNDLSDVKGLETVRHDGPSTIGIDTIYRSHGKIPLAFLRGGRARKLY